MITRLMKKQKGKRAWPNLWYFNKGRGVYMDEIGNEAEIHVDQGYGVHDRKEV